MGVYLRWIKLTYAGAKLVTFTLEIAMGEEGGGQLKEVGALL